MSALYKSEGTEMNWILFYCIVAWGWSYTWLDSKPDSFMEWLLFLIGAPIVLPFVCVAGAVIFINSIGRES